MTNYKCLSPACHLIRKIKINLLNKIHDSSPEILIFFYKVYTCLTSLYSQPPYYTI